MYSYVVGLVILRWCRCTYLTGVDVPRRYGCTSKYSAVICWIWIHEKISDLDPEKWYWSEQIRIRTTVYCLSFLLLYLMNSMLRIQTLLIRILLFSLIQIRIQLFDPDPDPYHFKEVMYLKQYFLYTLILFSLSVGPTGSSQKAYLVKFSIPVNFVVLR